MHPGNARTSGSKETDRLRGVMPRLIDALSFFIDAPNFVVRSCCQGGQVSTDGCSMISVIEAKIGRSLDCPCKAGVMLR